jgi:hypothetical protein
LAGQGFVQRSFLGFLDKEYPPPSDGHGVDQMNFLSCGGLEIGRILRFEVGEGGGRIAVER